MVKRGYTKASLLPHQAEGVKWLTENRGALLCDEQGLGKTRQILEAARRILKHGGLYVIAPASVVDVWYQEAMKIDFPMDKLLVTSYNKFALSGWDEEFPIQIIAADEAHFLKNWVSKRTAMFKKLLESTVYKKDAYGKEPYQKKFVWLSTGTPVKRGAMDLHSLLSFVQPGKWGKYKDFCKTYCHVRKNKWKPQGVEYYGSKSERKLNKKMSGVMLRRTKAEEMPNLPAKLVTHVPVDIGLDSKFSNQRILEQVMRTLEHETFMFTEEVYETLQELGIAKVPKVVQFIQESLDSVPAVIFAHHRYVVNQITEDLAAAGYRVGSILGGMTAAQKTETIRKFQEGELDYLVCSLIAAKEGVTLTRASHCVMAEFPWTWADLEQAMDRLHRIGQKDCVNVYYMIASRTYEETQVKVLESRREMSQTLLDFAE